MRKRVALPSHLARVHDAIWLAGLALTLTGLYLVSVTFLEWLARSVFQNSLYQWLFLVHVVLGVLCTVPVVYFIVRHFLAAYRRPNRQAVQVGIRLAIVILGVVLSGWLLIRIEGLALPSGWPRETMYWLHVLLPGLIVALYVRHRRVGIAMERAALRRRAMAALTMLALLVAAQVGYFALQDTTWERPFGPSMVEVPKGHQWREQELMQNGYCLRCHEASHRRWRSSAHHFSSLNNPVYAFSIANTRKKLLARDGNTHASRFCAGCHDPVLLLTGKFDKSDMGVDTAAASEGVNCIVCHAIREVPDRVGNGHYRIAPPEHYPFALSRNPLLSWLSDQLVKAKPDFHKKSFAPAVEKTPEFCGACHKVHIPKELNHYRWLRGQNHLDEFLLSGVSGISVSSFYYPEKMETNCNGCHMPDKPVSRPDDAAKLRGHGGQAVLKDHVFPSANTAIGLMHPDAEAAMEDKTRELQKSARVQLAGWRRGGSVDGPWSPMKALRLEDLLSEQDWLLEAVIRTTKMGHWLTGGTTDSNQLWLELTATVTEKNGRRWIARSGQLTEDGELDASAHQIKAELLDRKGQPIRDRNVEDIFVPLYNRQIPPGAADVVHYRLRWPEGAHPEQVTVQARLWYRKFPPYLWRKAGGTGTLPRVLLAENRWRIDRTGAVEMLGPKVPEWQAWNDYGIALLRQPAGRQLRQAREMFRNVWDNWLQPDAALNLARVALAEGRSDDAVAWINRAIKKGTDKPWLAEWLSAQVLVDNGRYREAYERMQKVLGSNWNQGEQRFDFSRDRRAQNKAAEVALTLSQMASGEKEKSHWLQRAEHHLQLALREDRENPDTWQNLWRLARLQGNQEKARNYRLLHERYRPDDTARGAAVLKARSADPVLDFLANPVPVHPLTWKQDDEH